MPFNNIEVAHIKKHMDPIIEKRQLAHFGDSDINLQYRIWANDIYIAALRYQGGRRIDNIFIKITINRAKKVWNITLKDRSNSWNQHNEMPFHCFSDAVKLLEDDRCWSTVG